MRQHKTRHHSAVETLPLELAQEVNTLITQGQTYRAIAAHLLDLEEAAMRATLVQFLQHLLTPDETLGTQNLLKILNGLARAQSAAVQREQWKAKQRKRIASGTEMERKGLSDKTVNEIKAKILGIPVERFVPDNNEMPFPSGPPEARPLVPHACSEEA